MLTVDLAAEVPTSEEALHPILDHGEVPPVDVALLWSIDCCG